VLSPTKLGENSGNCSADVCAPPLLTKHCDLGTPSHSETNKASLRVEVAHRYARLARNERRRGSRFNPLVRIRLRELERLFRYRWGYYLPDDDAGRDDLLLAAHHIAQLGGRSEERIVAWASLWAPWMPPYEAETLAKNIAHGPSRYKAASLGWWLGLTDAERTALRISTIRAIDVTPKEMAERRKKADRERKAKQRSLKRLSKPETITHRKPWLAQRISRATWYRLRKAQNKKPVRQNASAAKTRILLRTEIVSRSGLMMKPTA